MGGRNPDHQRHAGAAPDPGGPVDETVAPQPVREVSRPAWFTLMAPGWMHPAEQVTQALGICFTRWWARVTLDPWRPAHEMTGRRLVAPAEVLSTLFWPEKAIAGRLLDQAQAAERHHRTIRCRS